MSFFRRPQLGAPDRLIAWGVMLLTLVFYALSSVGSPEVTAGEVEYQSTSALLRTGRLALGGTPESDRLRAAAIAAPDEANRWHVRVVGEGTDAQVFGRHGVGQVLVAAPFYLLGRVAAALAPGLEAEAHRRAYGEEETSEALAHFAVGQRNPLLGALTVGVFAMCALRLGVGRARALYAALALAFTTYLWPQSRSSLSDVQATFFLLLALHFVLVARERLDRLEMPRGRVAFGIGAALAMAVLSRVAVVPAALFVAAAGEVVLRTGARRIQNSRWAVRGTKGVTPRRALILALTPVAAAFAVFVATNLARFGAPFDSGYGSVIAGEMFRSEGGSITDAFAGLWWSPGRGLLVMAPLSLLAPVGFWRGWFGGDRFVAVVVLAVTALVTLPALFVPEWHGASTYGPRYLLPALPFLWLLVALGLEHAVRHAWLSRLAR
jgi:hypothetical protein